MISILIPARNEPYLQRTVDDIFMHAEGDIEVLVGLDGYLEHKKPRLVVDSKYPLTVHAFMSSIGQRAMTNKLAKRAKGKYIMKLDAHCSLQQGFDTQMVKDMEDNMVMTGLLCRLDAKNWNIIPKPFTKRYHFNTDMVFQYDKHQEEKETLVETMALQGSMFMVERENYWKWNLCDEKYGSWGFQGAETACKTWFNGGRVVTNKNVFYGHMFRVENIPYKRTKKEVEQARKCAKELLKHPKMPELIKKFNYPGDWTPLKVEDLCK